ncbi:hypothetical protein FIBSPDRAFT_865558 [Athelia psychrophila]|uniref:Uncharacterized protein n=1 Tax=Athelia psychrophila TaxID=1759441 RepID=A0A166FH95_9AGAM|nr:hypothetical protein FIBSPDRAFT_865558 [Fibularhizoctonia sp. CBS 109695]
MKLHMLTRVHSFDVEDPEAVSKSVSRVDCRDTLQALSGHDSSPPARDCATPEESVRKKLCAVSQLKLAYMARVRSSPATTLR